MFTISNLIRRKKSEMPEKTSPFSWLEDLRDRILFLIDDPFLGPVPRRSAFSESMSEVGYGIEIDAERNAQKAEAARARIRELEQRELDAKLIYLDDYRASPDSDIEK